MSDTRVELRITFTVSSDRDKGREAAENAIYAIDYLATHGQLDDCYDFEVTRGSVNGNAWAERWPDKPASDTASDFLEGWDESSVPSDIVQRIIDRTDGMSDMSGQLPQLEQLAEHVRNLAKVVYLMVPKDA